MKTRCIEQINIREDKLFCLNSTPPSMRGKKYTFCYLKEGSVTLQPPFSRIA